VEVELVDALLADVGEVVLVNLRGFEREGVDAAEVFEVFRRDGEVGDGRDGEEENLLLAVAQLVDEEARDAVVLAGDLPAEGDALDDGVAPEAVLGERLAELGLAGREAADDVGHVDRRAGAVDGRRGRARRGGLLPLHAVGSEADEGGREGCQKDSFHKLFVV
jgi:hypothetical protein